MYDFFTKFERLSQITDELLHYHSLQAMKQIRGRVDSYLNALAIRTYYLNPERYNALDNDGKKVVDYLGSEKFYKDNLTERIYPLDAHMSSYIAATAHYINTPQSPNDPMVSQDIDGNVYSMLNGRQVFLQGNLEEARQYWQLLIYEQGPSHPHCYIEEGSDFNIREGDIVADLGGAEGFFCIKYLDKLKQAYIFEADDEWFRLLQKTYAPYRDKVTLIKGFVGDGEGNIKLDDYFMDKEKPTFFKMDVEGAEGSCLRSMKQLLVDPELSMRLAICTYHRQEDAPYIEWLLGDNFEIHYSNSYFWHMPDPIPPFLRHGVMRATKKI